MKTKTFKRGNHTLVFTQTEEVTDIIRYRWELINDPFINDWLHSKFQFDGLIYCPEKFTEKFFDLIDGKLINYK